MTDTAPAHLDRHDLRKVVAVLCASQITTWGVLFYAFPVLATTIARDRDWELPDLIAIFTGAQVLAAIAGVWVGRQLDRSGPRLAMTVGSTTGVVGVLVVAGSPNLAVFGLGWTLIGLAMSATLYPPAFAAVTHWAGPQRVRALTTVTLVGGLASTVFAPLTAVLEQATDWRTAYALLSIPLAATAALHWVGLRAPWTQRSEPGDEDLGRTGTLTALRGDHVVRSRRYLRLWFALALGGFAVYAVVVNLIPLLEQNGVGTTAAAVALGVGGLGQVAGRLLYEPLLDPIRPGPRTAATLAAAGVTTALIAGVHEPLAAVMLICFVAGLARGVFTLIQATAVTDRWGPESYGARNSLLTGSTTIAAALAPWGVAAGASVLGSYNGTFLVLAALALVASVGALRD